MEKFRKVPTGDEPDSVWRFVVYIVSVLIVYGLALCMLNVLIGVFG